MPSGASSGISIAWPRKKSAGPLVSMRPSLISTVKHGSVASRRIEVAPFGIVQFLHALQTKDLSYRDDRRVDAADRLRRQNLRRSVLHRANARAKQVIRPDQRCEPVLPEHLGRDRKSV